MSSFESRSPFLLGRGRSPVRSPIANGRYTNHPAFWAGNEPVSADVQLRQLLAARSSDEFARSLSRSDLMIASLNALARQHSYLVPNPPERAGQIDLAELEPEAAQRLRELPPETMVVRKDRNVLLFAACLALSRNGESVGYGTSGNVVASHMLLVNERFYPAYLDRLQKAARILHGEADRFYDPVAALIAAEISDRLATSKELRFIGTRYISVGERTKQGIVFSLRGVDEGRHQTVQEGGTIFIPRCGLSIFRDFSAMHEASDVDFVLSDDDPLVSRVVPKVLAAVRPSNIRFSAESMVVAASRLNRLDAVILATPGHVDPLTAARFSDEVRRGLKPHGRCYLFWQKQIHDKDAISAAGWEEALTSANLVMEPPIEVRVNISASAGAGPRRDFILFSGEKLQEILSQNLPALQIPGAYLTASRPKL